MLSGICGVKNGVKNDKIMLPFDLQIFNAEFSRRQKSKGSP